MRNTTGAEVVRRTHVTAPGSQAGSGRVPVVALLAGIALLGLAGAGAFASQKQLDALMSELDTKSLDRAAGLLNRTIEQMKGDLLSEVRVLSEDTRVRTTVMTPQFNEATVRDVMEDLRQASGASVMAVLDVRGKVQAVSGSSGLRGLDLGASPLISQALERAVVHVWTFPDQVLVIGLAPVRSGGQVTALFLVGQELGEKALAPIESTLGVAGAVVIRDKVAAMSSQTPAVEAVVQTAMALDEGSSHLIEGAGIQHLVKMSSTSEAAGAGRVIWVVPLHKQSARVDKLQILAWMPIVLVGLALTLAVSMFGRANRDAT
ncbi:MAG TPA: hypothetical protein VGG33_29085 [Polyangia bacterium]